MLSDAATFALAIVVLTCCGAGLAVWAWRVYRRYPFTFVQTSVYFLNLWLTRVLWRASFSGPLPVPPERGAVVVCNHRSSIDPCFIALATHRLVHWMVAKEYWANPLLAAFFRLGGSIPASRSGIDTAATKAAMRYVEAGDVIGLFPEGRINRSDRVLLPGRPGAAWIALKTRAPVIPCYVSGSPFDGTIWGFFFMSARVHLTIGPPLDLSEFYGREGDRMVLEEVTRRVLCAIAALAGQAGFKPEIAGRNSRPV